MTAQRLIVPDGTDVFFKEGMIYLAAIDSPPSIIASEEDIVEELEKRRFQVINFWECEGQGAPFRAPGKCGDEYDYLGLARKLAPSEMLPVPDLGVAGGVAWIMEMDPAPPPQPPGPQPPGPQPPGPQPPGPQPPGPQPSGPQPSGPQPTAPVRVSLAGPASARILVFGVGAAVAYGALGMRQRRSR